MAALEAARSLASLGLSLADFSSSPTRSGALALLVDNLPVLTKLLRWQSVHSRVAIDCEAAPVDTGAPKQVLVATVISVHLPEFPSCVFVIHLTALWGCPPRGLLYPASAALPGWDLLHRWLLPTSHTLRVSFAGQSSDQAFLDAVFGPHPGRFAGGDVQVLLGTAVGAGRLPLDTPRSLDGAVTALLGAHLSKSQQRSNWGGEALTPAQLAYAGEDAHRTHQLWQGLQSHTLNNWREPLAVGGTGILYVESLEEFVRGQAPACREMLDRNTVPRSLDTAAAMLTSLVAKLRHVASIPVLEVQVQDATRRLLHARRDLFGAFPWWRDGPVASAARVEAAARAPARVEDVANLTEHMGRLRVAPAVVAVPPRAPAAAGARVALAPTVVPAAVPNVEHRLPITAVRRKIANLTRKVTRGKTRLPAETPRDFQSRCLALWTPEKRAAHVARLNALVAEKDAILVATAEAFESADLEKFNEWLVGLGQPSQESITKAKDVLSKILINIFDLIEKRYHMVQPSVRALAVYTRKNQLVFPLEYAKKSLEKVFLRGLKRFWHD